MNTENATKLNLSRSCLHGSGTTVPVDLNFIKFEDVSDSSPDLLFYRDRVKMFFEEGEIIMVLDLKKRKTHSL